MLRIIIAILEALFGIESEAEAPPTRRQARRPNRPAGSGGAGSAGAGGEKPTTLEDVFKRLLGMEEEPPPARPVRRVQQPAEESAAARPQPQQQARARQARPAAREALAVPDERGEPAELTGTLASGAAEPAGEQPGRVRDARGGRGRALGNAGGRRAPPSAFAAKLRGNPAAAAEAFVYAEIFGPPMADRRGRESRQ